MSQGISKKVIASAVSLALSSTMLVAGVNAGTITGVDRDNLVVDAEGLIVVYQDSPDNLITNGFIDPDSDIEVYQEVFKSGLDFQGCVMAKLDLVSEDPEVTAPNCAAPQDSSKRIKLNATAVGPIDLIFDAENSGDAKLYRWYGKLGNQTPGRLTGFKVELVPAAANDGLGFTVLTDSTQTETIGNFPGGLFGGSPTTGPDGPFFSDLRAEFRPDAAPATAEDVIQSTTIPVPYKDVFGNWLPLQWVPLAWFFDDDGNPETDDLIRAWFDGTRWLDGRGNLISRADLASWETTPVTVTDDGALYATWDWENEVYVLTDGVTTLTAEEMQAELQGDPAKVRVPGYAIYPVEDLAKINVNYAIDLAAAPCSNEATCQFTVRVTPIAAEDASVMPAWIDPETGLPIDPIMSDDQPLPPSSDSGGGCTIGGDGRFDPTLPALAAAGLVFFGLRRFKTIK